MLRHIAIIPDGNRRWAKEHTLPTSIGHERGADALKKVLKNSFKYNIEYLSFWGSSLSNLTRRSKSEVGFLNKLYEENFKRIVAELKDKGVEGGIFGDIDLEEHREWVERVCSEVGIKAFLPLWGVKPEELIEEFLKLEFKATVIATTLEEDLLGKVFDNALVSQITKLGSHPCGESGEYHTFVTDGPPFRERIEIRESQRLDRDRHAILRILKADLKAK